MKGLGATGIILRASYLLKLHRIKTNLERYEHVGRATRADLRRSGPIILAVLLHIQGRRGLSPAFSKMGALPDRFGAWARIS